MTTRDIQFINVLTKKKITISFNVIQSEFDYPLYIAKKLNQNKQNIIVNNQAPFTTYLNLAELFTSDEYEKVYNKKKYKGEYNDKIKMLTLDVNGMAFETYDIDYVYKFYIYCKKQKYLTTSVHEGFQNMLISDTGEELEFFEIETNSAYKFRIDKDELEKIASDIGRKKRLTDTEYTHRQKFIDELNLMGIIEPAVSDDSLDFDYVLSPSINFYKLLEIFNDIVCDFNLVYCYIITPSNQQLYKMSKNYSTFVPTDSSKDSSEEEDKYRLSLFFNLTDGVIQVDVKYVKQRLHIHSQKLNIIDSIMGNEVIKRIMTDAPDEGTRKIITKITKRTVFPNIKDFDVNILYFMIWVNPMTNKLCYIDDSYNTMLNKTQKIIYIKTQNVNYMVYSKAYLRDEGTILEFIAQSNNEDNVSVVIYTLGYLMKLYEVNHNEIKKMIMPVIGTKKSKPDNETKTKSRKVLYKEKHKDVFFSGTCSNVPLVIGDANTPYDGIGIPSTYKNLKIVCDYNTNPHLGLAQASDKTNYFPCCYTDPQSRPVKLFQEYLQNPTNFNYFGQNTEIKKKADKTTGKINVISNTYSNIYQLFKNNKIIDIQQGPMNSLLACMVTCKPEFKRKITQESIIQEINNFNDKDIWHVGLQQFPFKNIEHIKSYFNNEKLWKDPALFSSIYSEFYKVNVLILYVNDDREYMTEYPINYRGDIKLPNYATMTWLSSYNFPYENTIILLAHYDTRSYTYTYPHVEPIVFDNNTYQWKTSDPIIQQLISVYKTKSNYYFNCIQKSGVVLNPTSVFKKITHQYIDEYGKCRIVWINNKYRVCVEPCQPLTNVKFVTHPALGPITDTITNDAITDTTNSNSSIFDDKINIQNLNIFHYNNTNIYDIVVTRDDIQLTLSIYMNDSLQISVTERDGVSPYYIAEYQQQLNTDYVDNARTTLRCTSMLYIWIKNLYDAYRQDTSVTNKTVSHFMNQYTYLQDETIPYDISYRPIFYTGNLNELVQLYAKLSHYFPTFFRTDGKIIISGHILFERLIYTFELYDKKGYIVSHLLFYNYTEDDFVTRPNENLIVNLSSYNTLKKIQSFVNIEYVNMNSSDWYKYVNHDVRYAHTILINDEPYLVQPAINKKIAILIGKKWKESHINIGYYGDNSIEPEEIEQISENTPYTTLTFDAKTNTIATIPNPNTVNILRKTIQGLKDIYIAVCKI